MGIIIEIRIPVAKVEFEALKDLLAKHITRELPFSLKVQADASLLGRLLCVHYTLLELLLIEAGPDCLHASSIS